MNTLNEDETAAAFLPASLFGSIKDGTNIGMFFAVYDTAVLFPITNATEIIQGTNTSVTTVLGSPVLAATIGVGLNFSGLKEPVTILLQLNEMDVSDKEHVQEVHGYLFHLGVSMFDYSYRM